MTSEQLASLIASGETIGVEFKSEEEKPLSDRELVEAVVCLANRPGQGVGWLLIGVEDDGRVTGARPRHDAGNTDPLRVQALIANRTRPSLSCRVDLTQVQGRPVLVIEVPSSRVPVGTTEGLYLRRAIGGRGLPECLPYHFHEMQSVQASKGTQDYCTLVIPEVTWDDLDPLEFERLRRTIQESRGQGDSTLLTLTDRELAKALGTVEANHSVTAVRVLGLLLFGREEALRSHLPTHEVAFQVLSGTHVIVNEFFRWPLVRLMDELMGHFRTRYREEELLVGMLRIGIPEYSERAFREAVANALVHRDYTRLGAVHIQWYDDRVEVSNPGGFPEGVRLDNILVTPPRPRSPLLADAFKRVGLVERTGRGVDTIFYEQLRNGRPAPSYARSTETDVSLVLPGGKANLAFVRLLTEQSQAGRALGLDEMLVLNSLWQERRLVTPEAAHLIQKSEAEARAVLEHLVEAGLVEARGERRGRIYHLSAAVYRALGERATYIRARSFEAVQMEQMILSYARTNNRITRREAAGLCQVRESQAYRILQRLVKTGQLRAVGASPRSRSYEPAV